MSRKNILLTIVMACLLVASFAAPGTARAWYGCGATYVVQWGDTLSGIAMLCGTSTAALRQANPNLGYYIYAGQTLYMPGYSSGYTPGGYTPGTTYGGTYVVARGDTMRIIANRMGMCVSDLIAANPQLWNPNLIYPGQIIYLPASSSYSCSSYGAPSTPSYYTVQWGDTLRIIARRYGTSVDQLVALNPQIWNPSWIYAGQVIRIY